MSAAYSRTDARVTRPGTRSDRERDGRERDGRERERAKRPQAEQAESSRNEHRLLGKERAERNDSERARAKRPQAESSRNEKQRAEGNERTVRASERESRRERAEQPEGKSVRADRHKDRSGRPNDGHARAPARAARTRRAPVDQTLNVDPPVCEHHACARRKIFFWGTHTAQKKMPSRRENKQRARKRAQLVSEERAASVVPTTVRWRFRCFAIRRQKLVMAHVDRRVADGRSRPRYQHRRSRRVACVGAEARLQGWLVRRATR